MKPVILITSYFVEKNRIEGASVYGNKKQDLAMCVFDYIYAVERAGGVPIVAPSIDDLEATSRMFEIADGILFSGGEDVHPKYYKEEIIEDNVTIVEKRDSFELSLAALALKSNKPLLGICRGMQLLNVAAGGSLHQDLKTNITHTLANIPKDRKVHHIEIVSNTKLHRICNERRKEVNSFHHQGVKDLANMYIPTAYAEDGIIEAFEMEGDRFLVGVQWHPEMLHERYPEELAIFKEFIEHAK
jgi:putative glutamine amidotransferase